MIVSLLFTDSVVMFFFIPDLMILLIYSSSVLFLLVNLIRGYLLWSC